VGNAESSDYLNKMVGALKERGVDPEATTLFVFNKNSYGAEVLRNSLSILREHFSSIMYLYQNPVHHKVLEKCGFERVLADGVSNVAHKNYKYSIFSLG
jgi:hypothetical protein